MVNVRKVMGGHKGVKTAAKDESDARREALRQKPLVEGAKSVEEVVQFTIRFLIFCTKDCIQGVWNKAPKGAGYGGKRLSGGLWPVS